MNEKILKLPFFQNLINLVVLALLALLCLFPSCISWRFRFHRPLPHPAGE